MSSGWRQSTCGGGRWLQQALASGQRQRQRQSGSRNPACGCVFLGSGYLGSAVAASAHPERQRIHRAGHRLRERVVFFLRRGWRAGDVPEPTSAACPLARPAIGQGPARGRKPSRSDLLLPLVFIFAHNLFCYPFTSPAPRLPFAPSPHTSTPPSSPAAIDRRRATNTANAARDRAAANRPLHALSCYWAT